MKILQVIAPGPYGGLERVVEALTHCLVVREAEVTVAMIHDAPAERLRPYVDALTSAGARVVGIPVSGRDYRAERARVATLCREVRPAVMHTHGYRCDVLMAGVARNLRIPQVTTVHGFTGGDWKNRVYEWLQKRAFRGFARVVVVSKKLAGDLESSGVPSERIAVVPNAWRCSTEPLSRSEALHQLGLAPGPFRIGWVGRLGREKGLDVLIESLPHLGIPFEVSILGSGAQLDDAKAQAADLGVSDRVRFHGAVADAGRLFTAFDVFALSSRTEGTPIALFEAMAARVPIVATMVGGVPDVVTPTEAVLVPSESPRQLADAIRSVALDAAGAAARAAAAADRLRTAYDVAPWVDEYLTIYESVQHSRVN